jgi:hypothetical protein
MFRAFAGGKPWWSVGSVLLLEIASILASLSYSLASARVKAPFGLCTHHLNSIEVLLDFAFPTFTRPAIKLGADVLGRGAPAPAHKFGSGYRLATGACPTVGIAGGDSLDGGHSPLSSTRDLAADDMLEEDVVLADGVYTDAAPPNADRYWALMGGGGGTYAVVLAMMARLHRN